MNVVVAKFFSHQAGNLRKKLVQTGRGGNYLGYFRADLHLAFPVRQQFLALVL